MRCIKCLQLMGLCLTIVFMTGCDSATPYVFDSSKYKGQEEKYAAAKNSFAARLVCGLMTAFYHQPSVARLVSGEKVVGDQMLQVMEEVEEGKNLAIFEISDTAVSIPAVDTTWPLKDGVASMTFGSKTDSQSPSLQFIASDTEPMLVITVEKDKDDETICKFPLKKVN